jgi:3-hydroxyisobutyrate dehydrogenase
MMLKDLRLAQDAAYGASANIAFGKQAEQLYAQLDQEGLTGKDFSVVMRHIKNG